MMGASSESLTTFSLVVVMITLLMSKANARTDLMAAEECFSTSGDYDCYYSLPADLETPDDETTEQKWPGNFVPTARLNLPIEQLRGTFEPYADFCRRNPEGCDLSGESVITLSRGTLALLRRINRTVNQEIECISDMFEFGKEEYWAYPVNGRGDCEDIALEKRRRLVRLGLPRGALRIATAQHRVSLYSHALLTVETSVGTYALDEDNDDIALWYVTQYNFESRERSDGRWERYNQAFWWFGSDI